MKLKRLSLAVLGASVSIMSSFLPFAPALAQPRNATQAPGAGNTAYGEFCREGNPDQDTFVNSRALRAVNKWYGSTRQLTCNRMAQNYARYVYQRRLDGAREVMNFSDFVLTMTFRVERHWNSRMWRGDGYRIGTVEGLAQDGVPLLRLTWVEPASGLSFFADYIMETGSVIYQGRRYEGPVRFFIVHAGIGSSIRTSPEAEPPLTAFRPDGSLSPVARVAEWWEGKTPEQQAAYIDGIGAATDVAQLLWDFRRGNGIGAVRQLRDLMQRNGGALARRFPRADQRIREFLADESGSVPIRPGLRSGRTASGLTPDEVRSVYRNPDEIRSQYEEIHTLYGRNYADHAAQQIENRAIDPARVEQTIQQGNARIDPNHPDRVQYFLSGENGRAGTQVVVDQNGVVITVHPTRRGF